MCGSNKDIFKTHERVCCIEKAFKFSIEKVAKSCIEKVSKRCN